MPINTSKNNVQIVDFLYQIKILYKLSHPDADRLTNCHQVCIAHLRSNTFNFQCNVSSSALLLFSTLTFFPFPSFSLLVFFLSLSSHLVLKLFFSLILSTFNYFLCVSCTFKFQAFLSVNT